MHQWSTIYTAICHRKRCHFVTYASYNVFHSHLWQSLFRTQFKRTHIFYVKRTSYVCDNFQSINCAKYVLGYISRSMQFHRKLWELFCIRPAYGVWIPQHTTQHTQVNTCEFGSVPHEKPELIKLEMTTIGPPHPMARHFFDWFSPKPQKKR